MRRTLLVLWLLAFAQTGLASAQGTPAEEGAAPSTTAAPADTPASGQPAGDPAAGEGQDSDSTTVPQDKPGLLENLWPLLLIFGVMYLFMFRGPKKKQKQHQEMLGALTKNDRVRTIGGIIGTVVDIRDDEVVLKIDEASNTKMRLARSAISKVYTEAETTS